MNNRSSRKIPKLYEVFINKELDRDHNYSNKNILKLLNDKKNKILLVGEVQSGKTNIIIDLIKFTIENFSYRYDIIILFGGTNIKLNDQTTKRLKEKYVEYSWKDKCTIKSFSQQYIEKNDANKTIIFIGPKIDKRLENIMSLIENIPNINDKKILIIDDESDYGSINTLEYKNETKYSKIIDTLFKLLNNNGSGYIGITATPYANIQNKKTYPYDHIFSLPNKSDDGYTGINYFNQLKNFYIDIDKHECNWISIQGNWTDQGKKYFYCFCIYIINLIIKNSIQLNINNNGDMLINRCYETKGHDDIKNILINIINHAKRSNINFCKILNNFTISLEKNISIKNEQVLQILNSINLITLNGNNIQETEGVNNIYIGGVLLSRGITYKNLILEYIDNFPTSSYISADTLLQMCRWFGYRRYLDEYNYINVVTTEKGILALQEVEQYNNLFFNENNCKGMKLSMANLQNKLEEIENKSIYVKGCSNAKK